MSTSKLTLDHAEGVGVMFFGGHVLETLVPEVEQQVAGRAGETRDGLAGLRHIMSPGV